MNESKLKPCPFCGGNARIGANYLGQYSVLCECCGAKVFFVRDGTLYTKKKKQEKLGTGGQTMSKEKQIEELARICASDCGECTQCENYRKGTLNGIDRCYLKYGEMIYNAGFRKQSEWISVEERVPQEGVDVLVALRIGDRLTVDTDRIYGGRWFAYGSRGYRGSGYVTYWMPLPEAPKGEE